MKKLTIFILIVSFIFCGRGERKAPLAETTPSQAESAEHAETGDGHRELKIPPEKQVQWGIEVTEISEIPVFSRISLPGVLTVNQNRTASISSFAEGKVVSLSVDVGDRVRKGQVLLTINSPVFAQAQVDFLQARASFLLSYREFERAKMLLEEKAIEQKEYLRREAEYEKATTEVGVKGSMLHSFGLNHDQIDTLVEKCKSLDPEGYLCEVADPNLTILSPVDGKIIFRDVTLGDYIEPKKILFAASDLSTLWALLDAYEKDLPFIREKSRVTISSSLFPEKEFSGKITYISDMINEKLRTAKVRVEVDNGEHLLKPNMYIQGAIENTEEERKALVVPEEAIQNLDGKKIVFVSEGENVFAVREVTLGERRGVLRFISRGLSPGERIVTSGAFNLKAELGKASFGQAHVH